MIQYQSVQKSLESLDERIDKLEKRINVLKEEKKIIVKHLTIQSNAVPRKKETK